MNVNGAEENLLERNIYIKARQTLRISVWTENSQPVQFKLRIKSADFAIHLNKKKDVQISRNSSKILKFDFSASKNLEKSNLFLVEIKNKTEAACSIASVQAVMKDRQAIFDENSNIKFNSTYQNFLQEAAIILQNVSRNFPHGFYLILMIKENQDLCFKKFNFTHSVEYVNVTVELKSVDTDLDGVFGSIVINSMAIILAVYAILFLGNFLITVSLDKYFGFEMECCFKEAVKKIQSKEKKKIIEAITETVTLPMRELHGTRDETDNVNEGLVQSPEGMNGTETNESIDPILDSRPHENFTEPTFWTLPWQKTRESDGEETDVTDGPTQGWCKILGCCLAEASPAPQKKLNETCQKMQDKHLRFKRSHLFSWLTVIVGIFYALPSYQLVYEHQRDFKAGNQEICYFNFLCTYPFWKFADFGKVFSNIGYIFSGIWFMIIVHSRQRKFNTLIQECEKGPVPDSDSSETQPEIRLSEIGIPEQFGLFYSLGWALILEGILSGIYHICPTSTNFQFDTTFMFFISVMVFLRVYQFRHPDTSLTAQASCQVKYFQLNLSHTHKKQVQVCTGVAQL